MAMATKRAMVMATVMAMVMVMATVMVMAMVMAMVTGRRVTDIIWKIARKRRDLVSGSDPGRSSITS